MKLLAALGGASFILASLIVGFRLLALWRRTRGYPELFAALALLTVGPIAFALFVPAVDLAERSFALSRVLYMAASGASTFGSAAVANFTLSVFHTGRAARNGAIAVTAALALSWLGIVATDDLDLRRLPGVWRNANTFLQIAIFLWGSLESAAFWRMMRRRSRGGVPHARLPAAARLPRLHRAQGGGAGAHVRILAAWRFVLARSGAPPDILRAGSAATRR